MVDPTNSSKSTTSVNRESLDSSSPATEKYWNGKRVEGFKKFGALAGLGGALTAAGVVAIIASPLLAAPMIGLGIATIGYASYKLYKTARKTQSVATPILNPSGHANRETVNVFGSSKKEERTDPFKAKTPSVAPGNNRIQYEYEDLGKMLIEKLITRNHPKEAEFEEVDLGKTVGTTPETHFINEREAILSQKRSAEELVDLLKDNEDFLVDEMKLKVEKFGYTDVKVISKKISPRGENASVEVEFSGTRKSSKQIIKAYLYLDHKDNTYKASLDIRGGIVDNRENTKQKSVVDDSGGNSPRSVQKGKTTATPKPEGDLTLEARVALDKDAFKLGEVKKHLFGDSIIYSYENLGERLVLKNAIEAASEPLPLPNILNKNLVVLMNEAKSRIEQFGYDKVDLECSLPEIDEAGGAKIEITYAGKNRKTQKNETGKAIFRLVPERDTYKASLEAWTDNNQSIDSPSSLQVERLEDDGIRQFFGDDLPLSSNIEPLNPAAAAATITTSPQASDSPRSVGSSREPSPVLMPDFSQENIELWDRIVGVFSQLAGIDKLKITDSKESTIGGKRSFEFDVDFTQNGVDKQAKAVVNITTYQGKEVALLEFREVPLANADLEGSFVFLERQKVETETTGIETDFVIFEPEEGEISKIFKPILIEAGMKENISMDAKFSAGRIKSAVYEYFGRTPFNKEDFQKSGGEAKSHLITYPFEGVDYTLLEQFAGKGKDADREGALYEGFPLNQIKVFNIDRKGSEVEFSEIEVPNVDRFLLALVNRGLSKDQIEAITYCLNQTLAADYVQKISILYDKIINKDELDTPNVTTPDQGYNIHIGSDLKPKIEFSANYVVKSNNELSRESEDSKNVPPRATGKVVISIDPMNTDKTANDASMDITESFRKP